MYVYLMCIIALFACLIMYSLPCVYSITHRSRSGAISFTPIPSPPHAVTPPPSSHSSQPKLNSSHSSYELGWTGRHPYKHAAVPEYYNLFVSAGKQHQIQPLFKYANPATVSSWPAIATSRRSDERLLEEDFVKRPTFRQSSNYSSTESNYSCRPVNGTLHEEAPQPRAPVSHYDRLEPRSTPGTPRFSPVPSASPESLSRDSTPRPGGLLSELRDDQ